MRAFLVIALVCCLFHFTVRDAHAGLYHPDILGAFDLDEKGNAIALGPDSFLTLLNMVKETNWTDKKLAVEFTQSLLEILNFTERVSRPSPARYLEVLDTLDGLKRKGLRNLSPAEKIKLSSELLRLRAEPRAIDEAITLLLNMRRQATEEVQFLMWSHYAYALALRFEFDPSYSNAESALKDYPFSLPFNDWSKAQQDWYRRLELNYYLTFLQLRKKAGNKEAPDPFFPFVARGKTEPVRYVGESGAFEPGEIAAAEKAKLPVDAIAILQQLVLWHPSDYRLIWQLAELYNANGDLRTAVQLFNMCVVELNCPSDTVRERRKKLLPALERLQEREAIAQAEMLRLAEEKKKAEEELKRRLKEEELRRYVMVGIGVALVLLFVTYWQTREIVRRIQHRRARAKSDSPS